MSPFLIAIIIILIVHYFLAIATIFILLRDKGIVKAIIPWNIVILLVPILGPGAYWIYKLVSGKK